MHRRVGDEHEAEDLVSEVFLSMVANLPRYRYRGAPFRAWLFRLATTQLSRWARRRRRWAKHEWKLRSASAEASETKDGPDNEMIDLVLSTLPPRLQSVLSLHYLAEMKVDEIANVLNCKAGTVKSRLAEGRALMRERLKKRGYEL